ncbi:MAG TPA: biotin carboxylase N-terminal domain-containing protein [Mycobacteriales bacterium]|nr:biotin carboxylase N-terminal domain-containing protein [Mycobacteriales bacterium]
MTLFETILVANRGEIARRVIRTAQQLGVKAVAVYSEADAKSLHVRDADDAVLLGPAPPAESYLDAAKVIEAARQSGAQAIHPGYGFLSENASFAAAVAAAGLVWIGPSPECISVMGDKINARNLMEAAGVPVASGTPTPLSDVEEAVAEGARIGYPLMVKATAGGGGIGMSVAYDEASLRTSFETARTRAERFFGNPAILLERYLPRARHVEVQILGLADGRVVALGERDCSVQRRHQKVLEETPSPGVDGPLRARMLAAAVRAGEAVGYRNAGTVECLVADGDFVFLEMNTRLQVEHPITELVTGLDLVAEQLRVAADLPPGFDPDAITTSGHAIEMRVYAEDPLRFLPGPGEINVWREPSGNGIRVDSGYGEGDTVTPYYDPLMAKLCVHADGRAAALDKARAAVEGFEIVGPKNNLPFFLELLANEEFASGDYDTRLVERMRAKQ